MNIFMPRERVFIPELDINGTVVGVYIGMTGTTYQVRYFKEDVAYEVSLFDFELDLPRVFNA